MYIQPVLIPLGFFISPFPLLLLSTLAGKEIKNIKKEKGDDFFERPQTEKITVRGRPFDPMHLKVLKV